MEEDGRSHPEQKTRIPTSTMDKIFHVSGAPVAVYVARFGIFSTRRYRVCNDGCESSR